MIQQRHGIALDDVESAFQEMTFIAGLKVR